MNEPKITKEFLKDIEKNLKSVNIPRLTYENGAYYMDGVKVELPDKLP